MIWLAKSKFLSFYQLFSETRIADQKVPVDLESAVIGTGIVLRGPSSSVFSPPTENKAPIIADYKYIISKCD